MTDYREHISEMADRLTEHCGVFLDRIAWIVKDAFRLFWRRILAIIILNLVGIGAAAAGFSGIFLIVKHLEHSAPIKFLEISIPLEGRSEVILIAVCMLTLLGIVSGASLYHTEWQTAKLAIDYQKRLISRLITIITDPAYDGWQEAVDDLPRLSLTRLCGSSTKITALALRHLLQGILPLCTFFFAASAMIITQTFLSVLLLPLIICYLIPFYRMVRNVSRQSTALGEAEPRSKARIKMAVNLALDTAAPQEQKIERVRKCLETDEFDNAQILFYQRKLADNRLQVLNTALFFSCLLILFAYYILLLPSPDRSWSELIFFVVALRFTVSGMRKVTSTIVKLGRFYPEYRAYTEFIDNTERIRSRRSRTEKGDPPPPSSLKFKSRFLGTAGTEKSLTVNKGQILWVLQPIPSSLGDLKAIAVWMEKESGASVDFLQNSAFYAEFSQDPRSTLLEASLGQTARKDREKYLWEEFKRLGVQEEISRLPGGLGTRVDDTSVGTLSKEALAAIHFGLPETAGTVFMNASLMSKLKPDFNRQLFSSSDAYYFLVTNNPRIILRQAFSRLCESAAGILIMNGPRIIELGDVEWLKTNRHLISRYYHQAKNSGEQTGTDPDFDEL